MTSLYSQVFRRYFWNNLRVFNNTIDRLDRYEIPKAESRIYMDKFILAGAENESFWIHQDTTHWFTGDLSSTWKDTILTLVSFTTCHLEKGQRECWYNNRTLCTQVHVFIHEEKNSNTKICIFSHIASFLFGLLANNNTAVKCYAADDSVVNIWDSNEKIQWK